MLSAVVPQPLSCKCCGGTAVLFGVVDFNRSCEDVSRLPVPLAGVPIYYHRGSRCGFLLTTPFDDSTEDDFRREIYNDQYERFDPEYRLAAAAQFTAADCGSSNGVSWKKRAIFSERLWQIWSSTTARRVSSMSAA